MKRIELLDYGRFLAIVGVVTFHYLFNGIANGKISSITYIPGISEIAKYGYLGVEFFFMISGYVIFFSAQNKTASEFAIARVVRLYPAFWFAVIFTSIFAFSWGGKLMSVSPTQIAINFTMIAPVFGHNFVDGVYWVLPYELKFYLLVLIFLLLGIQTKLKTVFFLWPFALLLCKLSGQHLPYLDGYYCYFAAGAILAIMKNNLTPKLAVALLICLILCISFSIANTPPVVKSKNSDVVIVLIITILFLFFLCVNSEKGSDLKLYGSRVLGDLSYPIYLIHAHFGYMFISQFATEKNKYIIYIVTVLLVFMVSYLMNIFVEKKLLKMWKMFFQKTIGDLISNIDRQLAGIR